MKQMLNAGAMAILLVAGAAPARAQTAWTDRGYVNISASYQPESPSFSETVRPISFVEAAIIDTGYKTKSIPGFEAGGGMRVWRNLAVGVDVSRFSKSTAGSVSGQIPHPFFFNQPRTVTGDASGLTRDETAVHLQALWMLPLSARWQLALAGGPSWFSVGQDLVTDVTVTQTYPFDTATFASATTAHRSASRAGFNVGADLGFRLRPHVGVGLGVLFSHARVPLDDTATIDAGGAHVTAGLRFGF